MRHFLRLIRRGARAAASVACLVAAAAFVPLAAGAAGAGQPGLRLALTATGPDGAPASDTLVTPGISLYVEAGRSPTPFLPAAPFSADWTGWIASEIRDQYAFQADLNGELKLEINGAPVWEAAAAPGTNARPSRPFRLNKGTNAFKLHYAGPPRGDAWIRLSWTTREFPPEPVAPAALSHPPDPDIQIADRLRLGRELFIEFRCARCHAGPPPAAALPDLAIDAPDFDGIGSRRNADWLARWIADPASLRPSAHMPRLLHGPGAREDAESAAAFLASLKSGSAPGEPPSPSAELAGAGKKLYETLHCLACHNTPGTTENDPQKISFGHVREKFPPGALEAFLARPGAHYTWTRMPDFRLSAEEAARLAAWLQSEAGPPPGKTPTADAAAVQRGKKVVQTAGCLNCHTLNLDNEFKARPLADLPPSAWTRGCLADKAETGSKAPEFPFTGPQRDALRAFGATDRASLTRHVPAEFATRQAAILRCAECHGKFEGFPPFEILGEKLRPEWMGAFIAGEVAYKPRPWIEARMPAFPRYAAGLAAGLAEAHGLPPIAGAEPAVDQEAAGVGRKLVSANGGFFCVSCHAVGKTAAMQVFESNGVNLAYTGARLRKSYFQRWVRNPLRIDPITKMPAYFDSEGHSQLVDFYNGDAEKQIDAIWQYVRLGDQMPPPPPPQ